MANLKGGSAEDGDNIKVCVRVRPFNQREKDLESVCCVRFPDETNVFIMDESGNERQFTFDRAYWSHDEKLANYATQETLMQELGMMLQENTLAGFNGCLFAYGQTGAGKTHSVLGLTDPPEMRGILPRIVEHLFETIDKDRKSTNPSTFKVEVSYLEIYNEVIHDLLIPPAQRHGKLEVHQHPKLGTVIPGLTETVVTNGAEVQKLIDFGSKTRTVAATCMNATSSRSHCVFCIELEKKAMVDGVESCLLARLNLVDLAGSERQKKTEASGARLKEGSMINQSLTNLSLVIHKLAEAATKKGKKGDFVPFRNSKLTFVLQDSLNGNSKTVMMAAISPALDNADETTGTLRFAESVKSIKTCASKNQESKGSIVKELKNEIEKLKQQLESGAASEEATKEVEALELLEKKYGQDLSTQLEEKRIADQRRQEALDDMGLTSQEMASCLGVDESTPKLLNINEDPMLSGCLVYFLFKGPPIWVGKSNECKIKLQGLGVTHQMASFTNFDDKKLILNVKDGRVLVNGYPNKTSKTLRHFDRLIFGYASCYRVNIPNDAAGRQSLESDVCDLRQALYEINNEDNENYKQCLSYFRELQSRVGAIKARAFLLDFSRLVPLVDEANLLAKELKPNEGFVYTTEVMIDLYTYELDEPECLVRLSQVDLPITRLKKAIRRKFLDRDIFSHVISKIDTGTGVESLLQMSTRKTIAVWNVPQFLERMKHLRDVYQLWCDSKEDVDLSDPRQNPFVQLTGLDVATIVNVAATNANKGNKLNANTSSKQVVEMKATIQMLQAKSAEREKKLQALELGNQQLRNVLVPTPSSVSGQRDLKEQLQVASEEASRAQKLTQDLLTHFEKAKRRIGGA